MNNHIGESQISSGSVRDVALRFQIGEFKLHTWTSRLALLYHSPKQPEMLGSIRGDLAGVLPEDADGVIIRGLPPEHFPEGVRRHRGAIEYVPRHSTTYLCDLDGDFDAYLARQLSAKSRQNIKRGVRKLQGLNQQGPLLEILTDAADMPRFLQEAAGISSRTFQSRLLNVGLLDTPMRRKHLHQTALAGEARGYLLKLNGQAIAFAWCRQRNDRLVYDIIGYLPEYAAHSPGTTLLYLILEDLFATHKYAALDFGSGDAHYKEMFATRAEVLADAFLFRRTVKNAVLARSHRHMLAFSIWASGLLDRLGLKSQVKKLLRRAAA